MSLHNKATLHHAEENDPVQDEDEDDGTDGITDGPCLITDLHKFLEEPFEIIYE